MDIVCVFSLPGVIHSQKKRGDIHMAVKLPDLCGDSVDSNAEHPLYQGACVLPTLASLDDTICFGMQLDNEEWFYGKPYILDSQSGKEKDKEYASIMLGYLVSCTAISQECLVTCRLAHTPTSEFSFNDMRVRSDDARVRIEMVTPVLESNGLSTSKEVITIDAPRVYIRKHPLLFDIKNSDKICCGISGGPVVLWSVHDSTPASILRRQSNTTLNHSVMSLVAVMQHTTPKMVFASELTLAMEDMTTQTVISTINAPFALPIGVIPYVATTAMEQSIIAVASPGLYGNVELLHDDGKYRIASLPQRESIRTMALSPNGKTMIIATAEGRLQHWDLGMRRIVEEWPCPMLQRIQALDRDQRFPTAVRINLTFSDDSKRVMLHTCLGVSVWTI